MSVVLCICTCKRPVGLGRLLEAVAELEFEGLLSVVVVDNDPTAAAGLEVCRRMALTYRWPLTCAVEEQRGIPFARNRAVAIALERDPDFIAMLDDDEWPCREWLRELLRVQAETGADVVGGPVFSEFPSCTPAWIIEGRLLEARSRHADGAPVLLHASNNFVAKSRCFRAMMPTPFNRDFALTGGSDFLFFRHLLKLNFQMRWAAHAHVFETVPPSRVNLRWMMQRRFRLGRNRVVIERLTEPGLGRELSRLTTTARLLLGASLQWITHCFNRVQRARATLGVCRALGRVAGHLGATYEEYRRLHGS